MAFVQNGYALASLDFRQSVEARFPAQVYDIKAAIRFLRAKARDYGYRVDRIAIAGVVLRRPPCGARRRQQRREGSRGSGG